jgi:signal transduction histidine kinase
MRPGHWIALDCVVAGFAALCAVASGAKSLPAGPKFPVVILFMAAIFIPVALRRKAPVAWFGALVILGVLLSGLGPAVSAFVFLSAAFVLYTVTVEARRRSGFAALVLLLVVMAFLAIAQLRPHHTGAGVLVPVALAAIIAWMTGYSVRQRRLYAVNVQQQAANSAVAEERLRIARELHDVVAHSMSVIAVQAGYGQYVIDVSPEGAKEALGAIQATSRDALDEMRRMLGVLRQQDAGSFPAGSFPAGSFPAGTAQAGSAPQAGTPQAGPRTAAAPLTPAPGLAGLDRLVARTCGAGVRVTVEITGQPRPAPAGVDLSAYRIIQEALTNVVKHAGTGAVCVVNLTYTDADLVIRVTDDGGLPAGLGTAGIAAAGAGHGIIGMRERVHLCGGTFDAGRLPAGGFEVTATLPLPLAGPPVWGDRAATGSGAGDERAADAVRATGAAFVVSPAFTPGITGAPDITGALDITGTQDMTGAPSMAGPNVTGTLNAADEPVSVLARGPAAVRHGRQAGRAADGSGE